MYGGYFNRAERSAMLRRPIDIWARSLAALLVFSVLMLGSPMGYVYAEEEPVESGEPIYQAPPESPPASPDNDPSPAGEDVGSGDPPPEESSESSSDTSDASHSGGSDGAAGGESSSGDEPSSDAGEETGSSAEDSETGPDVDPEGESQENTIPAESDEGASTQDGGEEDETSSSGEEGGGDNIVIETGDAVSIGEIQNEVNTNTADTGEIAEEAWSDTGEEEVVTEEEEVPPAEDGLGEAASSEEAGSGGESSESEEEISQEEASGSPGGDSSDGGRGGASSLDIEEEPAGGGTVLPEEDSDAAAPPDAAAGATASTTISNANDAAVENEVEADAETGENVALAEESEALIDTGDALASVNVINVVNTNIIDSNGFLLLLSALFGSGTFDLRDFDFGWSIGDAPVYTSLGESSSCSLEDCEGEEFDLMIINSSTAEIINDVVVRSETGENEASVESASVTTGDAYAGANVVNIANSNFIDTNYLLIALNNFGDFSGDIVFPGLSFFEDFFSIGGVLQDAAISNSNSAEVENNVSVEADTGGNVAEAEEGAAVIETGDAVSGVNVVNEVNTSLFGGDSLLILLRIHGTWSGDIFGLPPGISWVETPWGVQIFSDPNAAAGEEGDAPSNTSLVSSNQNSASILNNVEVYALSGENKAESTGGDASITTGDAAAGANIINIVNTNVIGQNWILAIFNIFGDWSGNLAFGRPDLWVGGRAESPHNPIHPGSPVEFHYTVTNFGDAVASDVILTNLFDRNLLSFGGYDGDLENGSGVLWNLGDIAPGETRLVTYVAEVPSNVLEGGVPIMTESFVTSLETDNNPEDNREELTIVSVHDVRRSFESPRNGLPYADLNIEKVASRAEIVASSTVDYTITVNNYGTSAYDATLYDTLYDDAGNAMAAQSWPLGEIFPDEEIVVTYTVAFSASSTPGAYKNSAQVKALDTRSLAEGGDANSDVAETFVTLTEPPEIVEACNTYIKSYIKRGENNDTEDVFKLQRFLIEQEGFTSLHITGEYTADTEQAVRVFQERYRTDILDPWGIERATGYVYYTTQKRINELACGGEKSFPLTADQLEEIKTFREQLERLHENGEPIDTSTVGFNEADIPARLAREEEDPNLQITGVRELIAGAAGAVEQERGTTFIDRLMNSLNRVFPWVSQKLDFMDILGTRP